MHAPSPGDESDSSNSSNDSIWLFWVKGLQGRSVMKQHMTPQGSHIYLPEEHGCEVKNLKMTRAKSRKRSGMYQTNFNNFHVPMLLCPYLVLTDRNTKAKTCHL